MLSNGSFSARLNAGKMLMMLSVLASVTLLLSAQSSTSNVSRTMVADSNNGLSSPGALAVGTDENVFIADTGNNRVVEEPWNSSAKAHAPIAWQ
jgi:hypothetical protein